MIFQAPTSNNNARLQIFWELIPRKAARTAAAFTAAQFDKKELLRICGRILDSGFSELALDFIGFNSLLHPAIREIINCFALAGPAIRFTARLNADDLACGHTFKDLRPELASAVRLEFHSGANPQKLPELVQACADAAQNQFEVRLVLDSDLKDCAASPDLARLLQSLDRKIALVKNTDAECGIWDDSAALSQSGALPLHPHAPIAAKALPACAAWHYLWITPAAEIYTLPAHKDGLADTVTAADNSDATGAPPQAPAHLPATGLTAAQQFYLRLARSMRQDSGTDADIRPHLPGLAVLHDKFDNAADKSIFLALLGGAHIPEELAALAGAKTGPAAPCAITVRENEDGTFAIDLADGSVIAQDHADVLARLDQLMHPGCKLAIAPTGTVAPLLTSLMPLIEFNCAQVTIPVYADGEIAAQALAALGTLNGQFKLRLAQDSPAKAWLEYAPASSARPAPAADIACSACLVGTAAAKILAQAETLLSSCPDIKCIAATCCASAEERIQAAQLKKTHGQRFLFLDTPERTARPELCNMAVQSAKGEYIVLATGGARLDASFFWKLAEFRQANRSRPDVLAAANTGNLDELKAEFATGRDVPAIWAIKRPLLQTGVLAFREFAPAPDFLFSLEVLLFIRDIQLLAPHGGQALLAPSGGETEFELPAATSALEILLKTLAHIERLAGKMAERLGPGALPGLIRKIMPQLWPALKEQLACARVQNTVSELLDPELLRRFLRFPEAMAFLLAEYVKIAAQANSPALQRRASAPDPACAANAACAEYDSAAKKQAIVPAITVILTNFNQRDHIAQAIASVRAQSLFELELIIVDNCSTDGSYEICQDHADLDGRIRLFRMGANSPSGSCLNRAIEQARGDYLIFMDGDGWLHQNFLELAVHDMAKEGASYIGYATQEVNHRGEIKARTRAIPEELDSAGAIRALWSGRISPDIRGKVLQREFIRENGIAFEPLSHYHDLFFLHQYALKAPKTVLKSDVVHSSRQNRNSLSRQEQFGHSQIKSALAMLKLREAAYQNRDLELNRDQVCAAQLACFEGLLLPALAAQYGMTGQIGLAAEELADLLASETGIFCLLAHAALPVQAPAAASEELTPDPEAFLQAAQKFAVVPALQLLQRAQAGDPGDEAIFLLTSGLVDRDYYLRENPDVQAAGIEPAIHYARQWQQERSRNPAPWFNTSAYLTSNPDVEEAGFNPFIHYIQHGFAEGRPLVGAATVAPQQMARSDFNSFFNYQFDGQRALLIEPNDCHGEVLPGLAKYLLDLDYDVDVLISPQQAAQEPFARMQSPRLHIRICQFSELAFYLQNAPNMSKYELALFSSFNIYRPIGEIIFPDILDCFPRLIRPRKGIYAVAHRGELAADVNPQSIRLVALHNIGRDDIPVVNPHYFGNINITAKTDGKTRFAVIGALDEPERRNLNLVLEAAAKLKAAGRRDFSVTLLGHGEIAIPDEIRDHFHKTGPAPFPELYRVLEEADFLLPLLDPADSRHDRYITTAAPGMFQLSLGSATPLVVAEKFALPRGITADNAVIYSAPDDLASAMLRAMDMTQIRYELMQAVIQAQSELLTADSLTNMRRIL